MTGTQHRLSNAQKGGHRHFVQESLVGPNCIVVILFPVEENVVIKRKMAALPWRAWLSRIGRTSALGNDSSLKLIAFYDSVSLVELLKFSRRVARSGLGCRGQKGSVAEGRAEVWFRSILRRGGKPYYSSSPPQASSAASAVLVRFTCKHG